MMDNRPSSIIACAGRKKKDLASTALILGDWNDKTIVVDTGRQAFEYRNCPVNKAFQGQNFEGKCFLWGVTAYDRKDVKILSITIDPIFKDRKNLKLKTAQREYLFTINDLQDYMAILHLLISEKMPNGENLLTVPVNIDPYIKENLFPPVGKPVVENIEYKVGDNYGVQRKEKVSKKVEEKVAKECSEQKTVQEVKMDDVNEKNDRVNTEPAKPAAAFRRQLSIKRKTEDTSIEPTKLNQKTMRNETNLPKTNDSDSSSDSMQKKAPEPSTQTQKITIPVETINTGIPQILNIKKGNITMNRPGIVRIQRPNAGSTSISFSGQHNTQSYNDKPTKQKQSLQTPYSELSTKKPASQNDISRPNTNQPATSIPAPQPSTSFSQTYNPPSSSQGRRAPLPLNPLLKQKLSMPTNRPPPTLAPIPAPIAPPTPPSLLSRTLTLNDCINTIRTPVVALNGKNNDDGWDIGGKIRVGEVKGLDNEDFDEFI